jgi:hypothetical protein
MRNITLLAVFLALTLAAALATMQAVGGSPPAYEPKFAGDLAHSQPEASALGYMRTVVVAEKLYKRKHGHYADSLSGLVGSGSFTRRMAQPDRGDYKVGFRPKPEGYALALTPKQFDPAHRAFYVDETGEFRVEDQKPANERSSRLE